MTISEEHLESILRVVRTSDLHDAREFLREFAAGCRQQGMVDIVKAIDASDTTHERLQALKERLDQMLEKPVQTWDHLTNEG
jgi:hypothetical protein